MYKHTFDKTILRSYDIRGIYGKTLTDEDAFMLGFFFGTTVRKKNPDKKHPLIIIGMDGTLWQGIPKLVRVLIQKLDFW